MKRHFLMFCCGNPDTGQPTVESLIREARELLTIGYPRQALGTARNALELALAAVVEKANCWPKRTKRHSKTQEVYIARRQKPSIPQLIACLEKVGCIHSYQTFRLKKAYWCGNKGAHPQPCGEKHVFFVIATVQEVMAMELPEARAPEPICLGVS